MRRLALAVCFSLALLVGAFAQDGDQPSAEDMAKGITELLKTELDLKPDQIDRVTAVLEKGLTRAFKGDDEGVKDEIVNGLKDVLDAGQQKELEVLVQEFDNQSGRFESGVEEFDPDFDPDKIPTEKLAARAELWLEGDAPTADRLVLKAENVLLLSEEEKKIVIPRVAAVMKIRQELRDLRHGKRADLGVALHAGAKSDEVKERLHAMRGRVAELEEKLATAEEKLREVVSLEQEARLVAIGVLD